MTCLYFLLGAVVTIAIGLPLELRYAKANYPKSMRWKAALFGTFFAGGTFFSLSIISAGDLDTMRATLFVLAMGSFFGVGFAFLFPMNLQNVIPKRRAPGQDK